MHTLEKEFRDSFGTIRHEALRNLIAKIFDKFAPKNILLTPSSSSGKYHPQDESGESGFYLHARRTAKIADDLARAFELTPYDRDVLVGSALIHDLFQYTDNPNKDVTREKIQTKTEHPVTLAEAIASPAERFRERERLISKVIRYHMGQWGPNETAKEWREKVAQIDREDLLVILMHIADYVASRRYIDIDIT